MAIEAIPRLRVDPELNLLVAPLAEDTRTDLENKMTSWGMSMPIRVWGTTILVDYEVYLFCRTNKIPLKLSAVAISNREEAISWICRDQLVRTDIPEEMRKYLIGKRCHAEKALGVMETTANKEAVKRGEVPVDNETSASVYDSTSVRTCERLGAEYHISYGTVRKYSFYAEALDLVYKQEPAFGRLILRGNIRLSHEHLVEISGLSRNELSRLAKYYFNGNEPNPTYLKYKALQYQDKPRAAPQEPTSSIKEMPEYDPDAEIASLALTVPSWVDSVRRTQKQTDFSKIGERARWKLVYELTNMIYIIDDLLKVLKEENYG